MQLTELSTMLLDPQFDCQASSCILLCYRVRTACSNRLEMSHHRTDMELQINAAKFHLQNAGAGPVRPVCQDLGAVVALQAQQVGGERAADARANAFGTNPLDGGRS